MNFLSRHSSLAIHMHNIVFLILTGDSRTWVAYIPWYSAAQDCRHPGLRGPCLSPLPVRYLPLSLRHCFKVSDQISEYWLWGGCDLMTHLSVLHIWLYTVQFVYSNLFVMYCILNLICLSLFRSFPCSVCICSQVTSQQQKNHHMLSSLLLGMPPPIKQNLSPTTLSVETLPPLCEIISPTFRPVTISPLLWILVLQVCIVPGKYSAVLSSGEEAVDLSSGYHDILWAYVQARERAGWPVHVHLGSVRCTLVGVYVLWNGYHCCKIC